MRGLMGMALAIGLAGCAGGPMTISEALEVAPARKLAQMPCADVPGWIAAEAARPADPADLAGSEARKARALNAAVAQMRKCQTKA